MSLHRAGGFMTRFLLLPLLLALSGNACAVSLGDELILSALGDPVEVEIEVQQWEDMDLDRVQISAASREEYAVFNLTWLPVLENLNFNLVGPDINGKVRVLVSSRDPLDEPFLELLLVLRWPGGSLRREYVLLFDPPGTPARVLSSVESAPAPANTQATPQLPLIEDPAPAAAPPPTEVEVATEVAPAAEPPLTAPVQEPPAVIVVQDPPAVEPEPPPPAVAVEEPVVEAAAEPEAAPEEEAGVPDARTTVAIDVETVTPQPAAAPPADTGRRAYQVRSGESLWNIARQFRPAGAGENLYQVLLSIHNLNRNSFINGNISLLKANAVLQVPSVEDIEGIDALTAQAEFERRWDQGTQRFEAAQRGEAIPLFAEEEPAEEAVHVEDELPPGVEAPLATDDADALIMVSQTNVPQPLQLGTGAEADAPSGVVPDTTGSGMAISTPAEPPATSAPPQTITLTVDTAPGASAAAESTTTEPRITTRALVTAELETEVAAMRARRESAEAVAQQLQASLDKARAERAASASIFDMENLLLAGSAVVLFSVLMAGIVMSLRLAGDLRSLRGGGSVALYPQSDSEWLAGRTSSRPEAHERKEPVMAEMEVVELPASALETTTPAPESGRAVTRNPDDLFARMDDMLGSDRGNPTKNN